MIDQILQRAETSDLVLIFLVWAIYKMDLRSKNGRKIDLYSVAGVTILGVLLIALRFATLIIRG